MTSQRGVALITALLVVALATVLAASAFRSLGLDLRRAQTLNAMEQGYQYARGLEAWARAILADDFEANGPLDHRLEPWAQGLPIIDVPGGRLTGTLEDLDGRFNLNNLVVGEQRQEAQIAMFRRLLGQLGLNPEIAAAVIDWQDANQYPEQRGAEDPGYMRSDPPYRAANRSFLHVSELRLVAGIDAAAYAALAPHVAALPTLGRVTPINVNTATGPVLAALHPSLTRRTADALHRDGKARFAGVDEFLQAPELNGLQLPGLEGRITVQSAYFRAHGVVELGDVRQHYHALLHRFGGEVRVLSHARGAD